MHDMLAQTTPAGDVEIVWRDTRREKGERRGKNGDPASGSGYINLRPEQGFQNPIHNPAFQSGGGAGQLTGQGLLSEKIKRQDSPTPEERMGAGGGDTQERTNELGCRLAAGEERSGEKEIVQTDRRELD